MTIQQCYEKFGGDYEEVLGRFSKEAFIRKFIIKFLSDKSYSDLFTALQNDDIETAFRAAHTLKGICQNLGFGKLYKSSSEVTELLRDGKNNLNDTIIDTFKGDYDLTVSAIQALE